MNNRIKIKIRIPKVIYKEALDDLRRSHAHAFERVGFFSSSHKWVNKNTAIIMIAKYYPVKDENYIEDSSVGARINSAAIRESMQLVINDNCGIFHVHLHEGGGKPIPSSTDLKEIPNIIQSFSNINADLLNGLIILSADSAHAEIKVKGYRKFIIPEVINIVGYPFKQIYSERRKGLFSKIYDRQSFLGANSQFTFENINVGVVGFGGGGSHIGQQLAHLGVKHVTVFDEDIIEDTNLNRLIGAWFSDLNNAMPKVTIAKRLIKKIFPSAIVNCVKDRWQNKPEILHSCDIILSGVDTYLGRQQLEAECRRYLIPNIDIGMDIHQVGDEPPQMSGQIILSMPGMPCMTCLGFLTEKKLEMEAAKYGDTGGRPQVVWANGVLASSAIGIFVDLVTGWTKQEEKMIYLSYNGNLNHIEDHIRLGFTGTACPHYNLKDTGTPKYLKL